MICNIISNYENVGAGRKRRDYSQRLLNLTCPPVSVSGGLAEMQILTQRVGLHSSQAQVGLLRWAGAM